MKTYSTLMLFLILHLTFFVSAQSVRENIQVKGQIKSEGKGIGGVAVTDGVSVVVTDNKGRYSLATTSDSEYIYYSLPAGYESPVVDGIPEFDKTLDVDKKNQKVDFELNKAAKSQDKHKFIVWADPQVLDPEDFDKLKVVVDDIRETLNEIEADVPVHAISLGDNVFDRLD